MNPSSTGDKSVCSFAGVELLKAGTWEASTGQATITRADIAAAVAAAPHLPDPVIKIGHIDPRFDGSPALGKVTNLRAADSGRLLLGDFVDMPDWLAQAAPRYFGQRSIEATVNFASDGKNYRFVLTGVALLGASWPAVTNLATLQHLIERF